MYQLSPLTYAKISNSIMCNIFCKYVTTMQCLNLTEHQNVSLLDWHRHNKWVKFTKYYQHSLNVITFIASEKIQTLRPASRLEKYLTPQHTNFIQIPSPVVAWVLKRNYSSAWIHTYVCSFISVGKFLCSWRCIHVPNLCRPFVSSVTYTFPHILRTHVFGTRHFIAC